MPSAFARSFERNIIGIFHFAIMRSFRREIGGICPSCALFGMTAPARKWRAHKNNRGPSAALLARISNMLKCHFY